MVAEIANKIIYPEWHPSEEKKKVFYKFNYIEYI